MRRPRGRAAGRPGGAPRFPGMVMIAERPAEAEAAFDKVLAFKDPGMSAAAAFRLGQLLYEFAENLFNAPVPPGVWAVTARPLVTIS